VTRQEYIAAGAMATISSWPGTPASVLAG
jgi:hypothetical protein